jgi:hypothetical protein
MRWAGQARFTLYGVKFITCPRRYFGEFHYCIKDIPYEDMPEYNDELDYNLFNCENSKQLLKVDQYSYFWVCNLPWPDSKMHAAPRAKMDDGYCDSITMRGDTNGRVNLTKLLINQDNGDYFNKDGQVRVNSGVEYKKTKCWRFTPKKSLKENISGTTFNTYYSIDGERYPIEPIHVKVVPSCLKLFCLNK